MGEREDAMSRLTQALEAEARGLGFADIGVCAPADAAEAGRRLRRWVAEGAHGDMAWMADRLDWRADPRALWPAARSVIMLAEPYPPASDPLEALRARDRGTISVYAQGGDYHVVVKKKLKRLGRWLVERAGGEIKVFVDTAPVMEKPLAEAAGLGWRGKHTNLVSRSLGSWFFLGAIFTTLDLAAAGGHRDRCGACRRCLDVCPTAAFPAPYRLDARRCISYLTIELKGPVPRQMRPLIGNRIYGCDDCLAVCPWNKFAGAAREIAYAPRPELSRPRLADLAELDDAAFREVFAGSPIKRIGRDRFVRNVLYAVGNSGDAALAPAAERRLADPAPLVRGAAVWALSRLRPAPALAARRPPQGDPDPEVEAEWRAALA
jgi:epoxyqueuosine reductase